GKLCCVGVPLPRWAGGSCGCGFAKGIAEVSTRSLTPQRAKNDPRKLRPPDGSKTGAIISTHEHFAESPYIREEMACRCLRIDNCVVPAGMRSANAHRCAETSTNWVG